MGRRQGLAWRGEISMDPPPSLRLPSSHSDPSFLRFSQGGTLIGTARSAACASFSSFHPLGRFRALTWPSIDPRLLSSPDARRTTARRSASYRAGHRLPGRLWRRRKSDRCRLPQARVAGDGRDPSRAGYVSSPPFFSSLHEVLSSESPRSSCFWLIFLRLNRQDHGPPGHHARSPQHCRSRRFHRVSLPRYKRQSNLVPDDVCLFC